MLAFGMPGPFELLILAALALGPIAIAAVILVVVLRKQPSKGAAPRED